MVHSGLCSRAHMARARSAGVQPGGAHARACGVAGTAQHGSAVAHQKRGRGVGGASEHSHTQCTAVGTRPTSSRTATPPPQPLPPAAHQRHHRDQGIGATDAIVCPLLHGLRLLQVVPPASSRHATMARCARAGVVGVVPPLASNGQSPCVPGFLCRTPRLFHAPEGPSSPRREVEAPDVGYDFVQVLHQRPHRASSCPRPVARRGTLAWGGGGLLLLLLASSGPLGRGECRFR